MNRTTLTSSSVLGVTVVAPIPGPTTDGVMAARLEQAHIEFCEFYERATPAEAILLDAVVLLGGVLREFRKRCPLPLTCLERWTKLRLEFDQLATAVGSTSTFQHLSHECRERLRENVLSLDS